ncbi:hypothetical protein TNCV_223761 [Trichonephila clavipes]|nr:hypothetical protein TNCV_223761 [Trichonephila clavipes]
MVSYIIYSITYSAPTCVLNPLQTFSYEFKNFPSLCRRRKKKSSSVLAYQRKPPNLPPLKVYVRKLGLANGLSKERIRLWDSSPVRHRGSIIIECITPSKETHNHFCLDVAGITIRSLVLVTPHVVDFDAGDNGGNCPRSFSEEREVTG